MHKHIGLWSLLEKAVSQGLKDVSEIQQKKMPEAGSGCLFILFFFFFISTQSSCVILGGFHLVHLPFSSCCPFFSFPHLVLVFLSLTGRH